MYETTCPNCGHVTKASFIRVGAVMVCDGCRQRFQVQPGKVVRKFNPVNESALVEITEAPPGHAGESVAKPAGPEPRSGGWTPPTTDADRKAPSKSSPPPPPSASRRSTNATASASPQSPSSAPPGRTRKKRRSSWSTIYALGASLTVTVVLIFALVIAAMDDGSEQRPHHPTGDQRTAGASLSLDPAVPVLTTETFAPAAWRLVDEEATTLTSTLDPLSIQQESWVLPPGVRDYLIYTAQTTTDGDAIARATLSLAMIDNNGRIYARSEVALLNITNRTTTTIAVPTHPDLHNRMALMLWEVRVDEPWPDAITIDDARIHAFDWGKQTMVRIKAFNPLAAAMKDMAFAISGVDGKGRPLGVWRVRCSDVLGPKRSLEFNALIDAPISDVIWTIHGAGIPATDP